MSDKPYHHSEHFQNWADLFFASSIGEYIPQSEAYNNFRKHTGLGWSLPEFRLAVKEWSSLCGYDFSFGYSSSEGKNIFVLTHKEKPHKNDHTNRTQILTIYERLLLSEKHLEMAQKILYDHCPGHAIEFTEIGQIRASLKRLKKHFAK